MIFTFFVLLLDNTDAVIFYLFPYLIEATRKRKRAKENDQPVKLTHEERRQSFFVHSEVVFFIHFVRQHYGFNFQIAADV